MVAPFATNGFSESDNYLHGAGRALGFVKMAACALNEPYSSQEVGEYHAYTGISAARTAIDATASWCNVILKLGLKPGNQVNLSRKDFQDSISRASPEVVAYVQALGDLGTKIDEHRQRAQHRDGLAIRYKFSRNSKHLTGWYLAPKGLSSDQTADLRLVNLLSGWANVIEENLREIHGVLVMDSGEMEEAKTFLARLEQIRSSA